MNRKPRPLTHRPTVPKVKTANAAEAAKARRVAYLADHRDEVAAEQKAAKAQRNAAAMRRVHVAAIRADLDTAERVAAELNARGDYDAMCEVERLASLTETRHLDDLIYVDTLRYDAQRTARLAGRAA